MPSGPCPALITKEILRYWSLLSPEQREAFLSEKQYEWLVREGLAAPRTKPLTTQDSLFDKFAGIFHAFSRLEEHVRTALDATPPRTKEAVYRLFGKKYDSLPSLVQKVLSDSTGDRVAVTGSSAVTQYAVIGREQAISLYCSDINSVVGSLLNENVLEETERFVNVRISETSDDLVYFDIRKTDGIPWASPVQAYVELMAGDKRDRETATQVAENLLMQMEVSRA